MLLVGPCASFGSQARGTDDEGVRLDHSVWAGLGYCLPNTQEWSYVSSPTLDLTYERQLGLAQGAVYGLKADMLVATNAIAGIRFAFAGVMETPLLQRRPLTFFLEAGLAFYTRPYKRTFDDDNVFIGSYFNCHAAVGVRYRMQLAENRMLAFDLRFQHSSNGYLKKPNQGLNYLQVGCGYSFPQSSARLARVDSTYREEMPERSFFVSYAPGLVLRRGGASNTHYFYTHTLQTGYLFSLHNGRYLGGNLDFMYNYAHDEEALEEGLKQPLPLYIGACVAYEKNWYPICVRVGVGTYLLKSEVVGMSVFEHIGVFYRIGRPSQDLRPFVGVGFKAHYAHVDYIEWTFGVSF